MTGFMINEVLQVYAEQGIKLNVLPKRVKNINFRLTALDDPPFISLLSVSYPIRLSKKNLVNALLNRLDWAVDCQTKQKAKQQQKQAANIPTHVNDISELANVSLKSQVFYQGQQVVVQDLLIAQGITPENLPKLDISQALVNLYKHTVMQFIQQRQSHWENIVGKRAHSVTPYRMKTRWGSCSTRARTIRLSIWLAQFPTACLDYVLVHELCHLHEANHSVRFWAQVAKAMPDYQLWHQQLKHGVMTV